MAVLLGVDLGTSSFKASAYDEAGEHLGTVSCPTPWRATAAGSELDPRGFGRAVRELVAACADAHAGGGPVAAIGVTGMAETMFVETVDGTVHPARAWNEQRPLPAELPDAALLARTGLLDLGRTPAVVLRRAAEAGTPVRGWSGLPDRAVGVLGGDVVAERSLTSRSGLVDVLTGTWSTPLCAWAGVADLELPSLIAAGTAAGACDLPGRCAGAVLTVAGHDHLVAGVGADAAADDVVFDSLGTGEAIIARIVRDHAVLGADDVARFLRAGFNVGLGLEDRDGVALAGLGTGTRLRILLGALAERGFPREELLRGGPSGAVTPLPPEALDLVETLGGPDWSTLRAAAAPILAGLAPDLAEARAVWWAAVARVTRNAQDALAALARLVPGASRVVAAGGWLGDPGIRALRERLLGPFGVPPVEQSGTRGAALLAGVAAGIHPRSELPALVRKGATA